MTRFTNILCEGSSEFAYLTRINKWLSDEKETASTFKPYDAGSGHFNSIKTIYTELKNHNKKTPFIIWVDFDIYQRNDSNNSDDYEARNKKSIPDFHFSRKNFEDFLVMHLDKNEVIKWQEACEKANHFEKPLEKEQYKHLFNEHFKNHPLLKDYKKGDFLYENFFNNNTFKNLFRNQEDDDILFECDLVNFLKEIIEPHSK